MPEIEIKEYRLNGFSLAKDKDYIYLKIFLPEQKISLRISPVFARALQDELGEAVEELKELRRTACYSSSQGIKANKRGFFTEEIKHE